MKSSRLSPLLYWSVVLLLFAGSLALRLYDIDDLPLDFHPTRQLFSALKARGLYYRALEDAPAWQREMAIQQWKMQATIEPEIVEHLAAFSYRLLGREDLRLPRVYSILFWELGGVFLFLAARRLVSPNGALLSLSFYLYLPYGVIASRSFQPDPLMVALLAAFFWAISKWKEAPTWKNALLTGLLGGAAIFVKTVALFFVGGGIAGIVLGEIGLRRAWKNAQVWILSILSLLPTTLYFIYGVFIRGFLTQQFGGRFFPRLLLSPLFYLRWALKVNMVIGYLGIAFALLGLLFFPRKHRGFLLGLWGGYLLYGIVFDYHFSTHDYYQLPLIPLAALSLAPLAEVLSDAIRSRWKDERVPRAAILLLWIFLLATASWTARSTLSAEDYHPLATTYREVGDMLRGKGGVVSLSKDYGYRLAYWGWLNTTHFPSLGDRYYQQLRGEKKDFSEIFAKHAGDRAFFLVTDFDEWEKEEELRAYLESHYPIFAKDEGFLIFDLRSTP